MIEKLENLLKNDLFDDFKLLMSKVAVNSHHREQLFKLAFVTQKEPFISFLETKVSLSKEKRADILMSTIQNKTEIKNEKYLENIDDIYLMSHFNLLSKNLVASQKEEILKKFVEKFPITTLINFKRMVLSSFQQNKNGFIEYLSKKEVEPEYVFYFGLCAIKFGNKEIFQKVVYSALEYDKDIIEKIKKEKEKYTKYMGAKNHISTKDDLNAFIDMALIETFSNKLRDELSVGKPVDLKSTKKKIKI